MKTEWMRRQRGNYYYVLQADLQRLLRYIPAYLDSKIFLVMRVFKGGPYIDKAIQEKTHILSSLTPKCVWLWNAGR